LEKILVKKIIAGNWKMFKNPEQTRAFFKSWKSRAMSASNEIVFFPPAVCLEAAAQELKGTPVRWGCQNAYFQGQGAFTGENSPQVIKEMGGHYVLLGHSERRQFFAETDEAIAKKAQYTQSLDLIAMVCIGETLEQRDQNKTNSVLSAQLMSCLSYKPLAKNLVIAYEPVWAIGTGRVAQPEQVAEAHALIKSVLSSLGLETVPVLYGGSVKADNCAKLAGLPGVDGFLVGGASLEVDSFLPIAATQF
jgi:triosephosphate isomerase